MAYALLQTSLWSDADFLALDADAQRLYLALISSPKINPFGVLDWIPARFASLAADTTPADVERALVALVRARFVLVDHDTGEVAVRTFARHDGRWKSWQGLRSLWGSWDSILSPYLRAALLAELPEAAWTNPKVSPPAACEALRHAPSTLAADGASDGASDGACHGGSDGASDGESDGDTDAPGGRGRGRGRGLLTRTKQNTLPGEFDRFWEIYPRRLDRGHAERAWNTVTRTADPEVIIAAAEAFAAKVARERTEARFVPHAATWLRGQRWLDDDTTRPTAPRVLNGAILDDGVL